jgi:TPR repeat protein
VPAPDTTPTVAPPDPAPLTEVAPIVAAAPAPDTTPTVAPPDPAPLIEAVPIVAAAPAALMPDTAPTVAMIGPATPPAEPVASTLKISAGEISSLLTRGDSLFGGRDVTSARLYYERAADAGDAQAALRLGETYDPAFLALARLNEVRGDPVVATRWYRRARELGNPEAEILLKSLRAN